MSSLSSSIFTSIFFQPSNNIFSISWIISFFRSLVHLFSFKLLILPLYFLEILCFSIFFLYVLSLFSYIDSILFDSLSIFFTFSFSLILFFLFLSFFSVPFTSSFSVFLSFNFLSPFVLLFFHPNSFFSPPFYIHFTSSLPPYNYFILPSFQIACIFQGIFPTEYKHTPSHVHTPSSLHTHKHKNNGVFIILYPGNILQTAHFLSTKKSW